MFGDQLNERLIDPLAKALDIDAVNEEFVAVLGQVAQRVSVDAEIREGLPAIGDDEVVAIAFAATEVDDEPRLSKRLAKLTEPTLIESAVAKEPRGDDDVRCPGIDPFGGVVGRDAAADLQSVRPGGECLASGFVVPLAQLDDVASTKVVAAVQFGEPSGRFFRDEIGAERVGLVVVDGASDDLFHPAVMQVDARPKHRRSLRPSTGRVEFSRNHYSSLFLVVTSTSLEGLEPVMPRGD